MPGSTSAANIELRAVALHRQLPFRPYKCLAERALACHLRGYVMLGLSEN